MINPLRSNSIPRILLFTLILFIACTQGNPTLERQREKVIQSATTLHEERARLQTMQDSLQTEIQRNISLGIPREQAENLERARVKMQETLVTAAEKNLAAQQTFLDSMMKFHP